MIVFYDASGRITQVTRGNVVLHEAEVDYFKTIGYQFIYHGEDVEQNQYYVDVNTSPLVLCIKTKLTSIPTSISVEASLDLPLTRGTIITLDGSKCVLEADEVVTIRFDHPGDYTLSIDAVEHLLYTGVITCSL